MDFHRIQQGLVKPSRVKSEGVFSLAKWKIIKTGIMENYMQQLQEQQRKLQYLDAKREQNLETLNKRVAEIEAKKRKQEK